MSRLPDEDFNIAGGSFSPGGAKVMARVLELVIPRTRGPASRAEFLVARAAELKAQEGLSDGAAAARVLAQLPPGDDREHVEVGGKQRRKETVRLAVKRGLHRLREDEARKLNAEARSRDLEVILGDEPDRQVLYGLGRSDKSCLEEARYMYRTTAAFRPFARAFCGQTPQGRV
jgi:hypothetical protein